MRRSFLLFFIAAILCFPVGLVTAQDGEGAAIGASIDQAATENGLSTGDGKVSPVERDLGNGISTQIQTHEAALEQVTASKDPRAAAISGAVKWYEDYANSLKEKGQTDKLDKLDAGDSADAVDAGDTDLADNVAQIDEFTQQQEATGKFDPRAAAISGAVAQYGVTAAPATKKQVVDTVRKGANKYIESSKLKHKKLTKRRINILLNRILAEKEEDSLLPTNGYWRAEPFSMKLTGKCKALTGDNGGMGAYENEKDPGQPLCGFRNPGGLPYITWNSGMHIYEPGTVNIYSAGSSTRYEVSQDSDGQSTGSVVVTTTTRYQVISKSEIRVLLTIEEKGGCSMSAEYKIKLVTADESICAPSQQLPTPTAMPTETSGTQPTPPPGGPVPSEGPYHSGSPIFTDQTQCNDSNTPPQITDLHIRQQTENTILLDYGSGTQVLYRAGDNFYTYESGSRGPTRTSISLSVLDDGSVSIFWSVTVKAGFKQCSMSQTFNLPGSQPEATSTPGTDSTPSGEATPAAGSAGDASQPADLEEGHYTVKWTVMDALCPADMKSTMPTFTEATVTRADATTVSVNFAGGSYTLLDYSGQHLYMLADGRQGDLRYVASLMSNGPGAAFFSWVGSPASDTSKTCTVMADFTKQ